MGSSGPGFTGLSLSATVTDMRVYGVWYRNEPDGRAPECAFLDLDYSHAGELHAMNLRDLYQRLGLTKADEETELDGQRPIRVGDVVQEGSGAYWIFTPTGVWASVQAFLGGGEQAGEQAGDQ